MPRESLATYPFGRCGAQRAIRVFGLVARCTERREVYETFVAQADVGDVMDVH